MFVVLYFNVKDKKDAEEVMSRIDEIVHGRSASYDLMCSGCGEEMYKHENEEECKDE